MKNNLFVILLILSSWSSAAKADTVTTKDGEQYYGKVVSQDSNKVILEMKIGIIKFPYEEVASIELTPPTVKSSDVSAETGLAPAEISVKKPLPQVIPWNPRQRTPEQEEMLKREAETYKKLDEMIRARELKKQEELKKKQLEEEKKKAAETKTMESKPEEKVETTAPKKELPQPTLIQPTIRGLEKDRYKTY